MKKLQTVPKNQSSLTVAWRDPHASADTLFEKPNRCIGARSGSANESVGLMDREMAAILLDYAWVLRQTGRKSEGWKLESRARTILAMHPGDSSRLSVDVSELLSPQRKVR
jgi:hypothetical protein